MEQVCGDVLPVAPPADLDPIMRTIEIPCPFRRHTAERMEMQRGRQSYPLRDPLSMNEGATKSPELLGLRADLVITSFQASQPAGAGETA